MSSERLLVRTSSRLHLGLLGWGPGARRQFGGLGLMLESPPVEIQVESAARPSVEGILQERTSRILALLQERMPPLGIRTKPASVRVLQAPPEHVGLGVGTQLSLAIAAGLLRLGGVSDASLELLAGLTGRGCRSGIGLHGFARGGLLVDGGHRQEGGVPPLVASAAFPQDWSILIVQPPGPRGLHGAEEREAFVKLPPVPAALTDRLCRLVLLDILPAVAERDLDAFGAAVEELQARVGASFAPAQGGAFGSPASGSIMAALHRLGFTGCGQSSWGPTLYAFTDRKPDEVRLLAQELSDQLELSPSAATVTRAANRGAFIEDV